MSGGKADLRDFQEALAEIATKEGLTNWKIVDKSTTSKGDGYLGLISFVDLIGVKNGQNAALSLAIKSAPKDENARKHIDTRGAFITENYAYSQILEYFKKFELENNIETPFSSISKYYAVSDKEYNEFIVFENLRTLGFCLRGREKTYSKEHLELVAKEYGKLHALSYALRRKQPAVFEKLSGKLDRSLLCQFFEKLQRRVMKMISDDVVNYLIKKGKTAQAEAMDRYCKDALTNILKDIQEKDEFSVIAHGDCWGNNFMFKYDGENLDEPKTMKILDWQACCLTSPVTDIGYFYWACADSQHYKNHLDFIKLYHDSLTSRLEEFGVNAQQALPFEELKKRWLKSGIRLGFIMALYVFKGLVIGEDEVPSFSDSPDEGGEDLFFYIKIKKMDEYLQKCETLVDFMYENGLFQL